jgi:hypothetical protein
MVWRGSTALARTVCPFAWSWHGRRVMRYVAGDQLDAARSGVLRTAAIGIWDDAVRAYHHGEVTDEATSRQVRDRYLALLTAVQAPTSRVRVVLGVRADFYAACTQHPGLVDVLQHGQVPVGLMTVDELRRAITQPAMRAGGMVETALLAELIADTADRLGVLPHVSHALLETWRRRRGTTLTLSGYQAAGGIGHALARTAETIYLGLAPGQRQLAKHLFLRLTAPGDGTEDTKQRIALADLDHEDQSQNSVGGR